MKDILAIATLSIIFIGAVWLQGYSEIPDYTPVLKFGAKPLIVGEKVRYLGDIPSAYNQVGWIVDIQDRMFAGRHPNDTPYMIAFSKRIKPSEIETKWNARYEANKEDYEGYAYSHPFPYGVPDELRWTWTNRVWASEDQLERINTSYKKNIKKGIKSLISVELESLTPEEYQKVEEALLPPTEWYELMGILNPMIQLDL